MDASTSVARAAVIGVGNEYRRDDGVGWAVVACLARREKRRPLPHGVRLTCTDGDPGRLISAWDQVQLAILVDAAHARPARPGRVHRLRLPGELPSTPREEAGSHGFPLGATLRLARALGRLPEELLVYAVEATDTGLGTGMSPQVAAAVEPLAQRIEEDLLRRFRSGQ
ncbi:hydrogenase maturation protease [Streptomyces sp. NPDC001657]|uniref:hydrogenase maturation protease n=1 Tax=Streptomyces sp. NPDC001657 TaxID=3154522 RepID=UPI00332678B1